MTLLCPAGSCRRHTNAWLGPAGTVTPLHFDSYDNVLTQAFGTKRVRLYGAAQTRFLYVVDAASKRSDGTASGGVEAQGSSAHMARRGPRV